MLALTLLLSLVAAVVCSQIDQLSVLDRSPAKRQSSATSNPPTPSFNISIPIDHFNNSDTRTYNNQYWVNDTWYEPGGPIFFFDAGEAGVTAQTVNLYLANDSSSVIALARKYSGLAILWEHRYYGGSLPFPLNTTARTSLGVYEPIGAPASFQYLTVEQALQDVVYFANNLKEGGYQANDLDLLHPSKTPWVWVGGSYPGIRGTLLRTRQYLFNRLRLLSADRKNRQPRSDIRCMGVISAHTSHVLRRKLSLANCTVTTTKLLH